MPRTRTAVLIHGFHLQSAMTSNGRVYDWRDLAIGRIEDGHLNGRATYGVGLAFKECADTIIFSTGASERDGLKEAQYTHREIVRESERISRALGVTSDHFQEWLLTRVRLDIESQTTAEELRRNLTWCAEHDHHRVFLITSRFHAPRALANAHAVSARLGLHKLQLFASAPDDPSPAPVIFEPPTRPDRPSHDWHGTLPGIFSIPDAHQAAALAEIQAVIAKYKL
ncbi:MAG: ElyC/SanA/YdcF family protein [Patescibacteria group bacterium]|jgi:hypothetical protein